MRRVRNGRKKLQRKTKLKMMKKHFASIKQQRITLSLIPNSSAMTM